MTLHVQFLTLFMMFCSGIILGVLFDSYRVLSVKLRFPRWVVPIADVVYWIVATILVFRILIYSNEGQVRMFIFLGILIGLCFYFAILSRWTIKLVLFIIRLIQAIYRIICKIVELFLIKPVVGLYRLIYLFFGFLVAVAIFLYKIVLQLLHPLWRLLLWIFRPLRKILVMPNWLTTALKKITGFFRRLF